MVFALRSVSVSQHFIGRGFTFDRIVMRFLMRRYVLSVLFANLTVRQQIVFRLNNCCSSLETAEMKPSAVVWKVI